MPLETIACTNCGSTDVQEVKPSTFFCNHCETVFRHIDPTRLTVDYSPAFCACGTSIRFQCQVCRAGICSGCDVIEWKRRRDEETRRSIYPFNIPGPSDSDSLYGKLHVPVVGYGYLRQRFLPDSEIWAIVDNHIIRIRERDSRSGGPFLYVDELLSTIRAAGLNHVCCSCVTAAVPQTADNIANRVMCEQPGCVSVPSDECRCCRSSFCGEHLTPTALARCGQAARSGHVKTADISSCGTSMWPSSHHSAEWIIPGGMCLGCVAEKVQDAARTAGEICEGDQRLRLVREWGVEFQIPLTSPMRSRRRDAEARDAAKAAERFAAEITRHLNDSIAPGAGVCKREQFLHESYRYRVEIGIVTRYAIFDERASVSPAAVRAETGTL
jgi:hypothetical protein